MADVTISILDNGPLIVKGDVDLLDAEGNAFPKKEQIALCRCGASQNRPFCDGSHAKAGFQSTERAS
ncbi:MAG: CDGSH iron-sulfur domain-containing protein [Jaaginema sp. PMC 1079.18]|nr:CDGSH iron-sulfur domain-containing protein [Jaaginema sp. PMC 1080.18]MEC4851207.1 CDGSH iron-sulfur domain-containing protein [Jaaginema sp. PMC 1079.18]MEC4865688.1 CDGSH iron-sulfur domain-containing protein [Jaaginema sp. PMC 1078.18]